MKMPVMFIGHGSPMNALEENEITLTWKELGSLYNPEAILVVSGHWYTRGTRVMSNEIPEKVNDMNGFPNVLYDLEYECNGNVQLAEKIKNMAKQFVTLDDSWGVDQSAWTILNQMYPDANIPVVVLSIDALKTPEEHFQLGKELSKLRNEGVLVIGSGNIVHNQPATTVREKGYPWAYEFDNYIKEAILEREFSKCINYLEHKAGTKAVPEIDHFAPLLYVLGMTKDKDKIEVLNQELQYGSVSMTSYIFK